LPDRPLADHPPNIESLAKLSGTGSDRFRAHAQHAANSICFALGALTSRVEPIFRLQLYPPLEKADVVVLALGEDTGMSGEAASRSKLGLTRTPAGTARESWPPATGSDFVQWTPTHSALGVDSRSGSVGAWFSGIQAEAGPGAKRCM